MMADKPVFIVGLDLGQRKDFSALVVLRKRMVDDTNVEPVPERTVKVNEPLATFEVPPKLVSKYTATLLQRFEQGTSYSDIVSRVCGLFCQPEIAGSVLVPDWTGVGIAVLDMLRQAKRDPVRCPKCKATGLVDDPLSKFSVACKTCNGDGKIILNAKLRPVYITAGARWSVQGDGFNVAKAELVSILQVLLQANPGRLVFDERLQWARTLRDELNNFAVKITASANETFAAWRESIHDDLVLATAVAAWVAERGMQKFWVH